MVVKQRLLNVGVGMPEEVDGSTGEGVSLSLSTTKESGLWPTTSTVAFPVVAVVPSKNMKSTKLHALNSSHHSFSCQPSNVVVEQKLV